jgi:3-dehydroquinate synthase
MRDIPVTLPQASYEIRVGAGLFASLWDQLSDSGFQEPYFVVTQPRILNAIGRGRVSGFQVASIPDGERAKTLVTVNRLIGAMVKQKLNRQSTLVALGGGVVGDVSAFVASIYMRGIRVVQVPTTLLAQVDSSIGGKTGINHQIAKNLIGTFHQPALVLSDPTLLKSLPDREYRSGLYEALKYGIITDRRLFDDFERETSVLLSRHPEAVERLVASCAAIKARIVMADEKEGDLRRILNFGHTVGHALETAGKYHRIKHGEAVGYGMIAAARISASMGKLQDQQRIQIENAIRRIGRLPYLDGVHAREVLTSLQHDKKVRDGAVHFVLPRAIGEVEVTPDVPLSLVKDVVKELLDESKRPR